MAGTSRRPPEEQRPSPIWVLIAMLAIVLLLVATSAAIATASRPSHSAPSEGEPHASPAPGESHEPGGSPGPVETPHGLVVRFPAA